MITWRLPEPLTRRVLARGRRRHPALTLESSLRGPYARLAVRPLTEAERIHERATSQATQAERDSAAVATDAWSDGDWTRFAAVLALELAELEHDHVLILHDRHQSESYVQFIQFGEHSMDFLRAETISDHFLESHRQLSDWQRRRLAELGWVDPGPEAEANWSLDVPWPGRWSDYRRAAELSVAALRDVHGVRTPADLVLAGWGYDHQLPAPYPRLGLGTT
jgi:hypothetical protein